MRHKKKGRKLGRDSAHRQAMFRNMAASLFQHRRIRTTAAKAKELQPFAEKLITIARRGTIADRRNVASMLGDVKVAEIDKDTEKPVKRKAVSVLFNDIAPKFAARNGGYTRIIHLQKKRLGDGGPQVFIELILEEETEAEPAKGKKKKKAKKSTKPKAEKTEPKAEEKPAEPEVTEEAPAEEPAAEAETPEEPAEETPEPEAETEKPEEPPAES